MSKTGMRRKNLLTTDLVQSNIIKAIPKGVVFDVNVNKKLTLAWKVKFHSVLISLINVWSFKRKFVTTVKRISNACPGNADIEDILNELGVIRTNILSELAMSKTRLDEVHANNRDSARNLLHYMALRRHDLRPLQLRLAKLGLSSGKPNNRDHPWQKNQKKRK